MRFLFSFFGFGNSGLCRKDKKHPNTRVRKRTRRRIWRDNHVAGVKLLVPDRRGAATDS